MRASPSVFSGLFPPLLVVFLCRRVLMQERPGQSSVLSGAEQGMVEFLMA